MRYTLTMALVLVGGSMSILPANAQSGKELRFGTVGVGSSWYNYGAGMANMVQPKLPEGYSISVLPQAGGIGNIKLVQSGEMEFGITFSVSTSEACSGTGVFAGEKYDKVLGVMGGLDKYYLGTFVNKSSDVTSWEEIVEAKGGFHLLTTRPGGTGEQAVRQVLGLMNSSPDDVAAKGGEVEATGRSGAAESLRDGRADGWVHVVTKGHPAATQIVSINDTNVLDLPDAVIEGMVNEHGWSAAEIPDKTFEDQTGPVKTVSTSSQIIASASVPEEIVYEFTKTIVENAQKLPSIHAALSDFDPKSAADPALNGNCPLHPGAERYYREAGLLR